MTHAFSVNAVRVSRNGKCIYAIQSSPLLGNVVKRPVADVAKSVNGQDRRLMRLTSRNELGSNPRGAVSALQPLEASGRYHPTGRLAASRWRPLPGPGKGMSEAALPCQARNPGPPRDETPGCTPNQDHAVRMGPPNPPPLLPENPAYIHPHIHRHE